MKRFINYIVILIFLSSYISKSSEKELKLLNRNQVYNLRILRVYDKRLPDLDNREYEKLYQLFIKDVKEYLGYNIKFKKIGKVEILDFFNLFEKDFKKSENQEILSTDIELNSDIDKQRLKLVIENIIKKLGNNITYYLPFNTKNDFQKIKNSLYNNFIKKINEIREIKINNTENFYNKVYYKTQSYVYWSIIANNVKTADIIITNTMIASADTGMPIYVINRGGITSGFVENNNSNFPYYGVGVIGLFQYISKDQFFIKYRDLIPKDELLNVISMLFTHEMGHLLMRADEMYIPEAGVHTAPVDLQYYKWYKKIKQMKDKHPIDWIPRLKKF